jgi:hypothetical protein
MQIFQTVMAPRRVQDGTYAISSVVSPQTEPPLFDAAADSGKFVAAILADLDRFEGKVILGATEIYSFRDIAKVISDATGKTVVYQQLSVDIFSGAMPPGVADGLVDMMPYFQNVGYFGPKTKDMVTWAAETARGQLTTFEEFARANIHLE